MINRLSKVIIPLVSVTWLGGCALILEEQADVEAEFYYEPHSASIPSAYIVRLPESRMVR